MGVVLMGHSLGGLTALLAAGLEPEPGLARRCSKGPAACPSPTPPVCCNASCPASACPRPPPRPPSLRGLVLFSGFGSLLWPQRGLTPLHGAGADGRGNPRSDHPAVAGAAGSVPPDGKSPQPPGAGGWGKPFFAGADDGPGRGGVRPGGGPGGGGSGHGAAAAAADHHGISLWPQPTPAVRLPGAATGEGEGLRAGRRRRPALDSLLQP